MKLKNMLYKRYFGQKKSFGLLSEIKTKLLQFFEPTLRLLYLNDIQIYYKKAKIHFKYLRVPALF